MNLRSAKQVGFRLRLNPTYHWISLSPYPKRRAR